MQAKKKMLAVDDDPNNTTIVEELFGDHYDLRTAATGKEALKTALDFQPDVILLDIMLPDMNGYEVCRLLREHSSLSHTKIIMVSAKGAIDDRVRGYKVGANDYITKPFEEENIMESVAFFL